MSRVYLKKAWYFCKIIGEACGEDGLGKPDCINCGFYNNWIKRGKPKLKR